MQTIRTTGIAAHAPDRFGAGGIIAALTLCKSCPGYVVRFAVADHPNDGGKVHRIVAVGYAYIDGCGWRFRYCGEGDKPDGAGSHTLGPYTSDIPEAAVELALNVGRYGRGVYRLGDSTAVVDE